MTDAQQSLDGPAPDWSAQLTDLSSGIATWVLRATTAAVAPSALHVSTLIAGGLRGGLLTDLCLAGFVEDTPTGIQVGSPPTGFELGDELLADVADHPAHPIERWLQRGRPHGNAIADHVAAAGFVNHVLMPTGPHYRSEADPLARTALVDLHRYHENGHAPSAHIAAVAAICAALGTLGRQRYAAGLPDSLVDECQAAGGIVRTIVEYLLDAAADDLAAGMANAEANIFGGGAFTPGT